jgi:hypothetical protein
MSLSATDARRRLVLGDIKEFGFFVIPAQAGILIAPLDSCLYGNACLP